MFFPFICSNFLSPSLRAFGLSRTIRMPSLLAQRRGFYKWWSLQTYVSLWAPSPLVHVSVSSSCFLFCLYMIIWGIMISYPILCVSNQHIGGYHGSHGSKWIFGLIPPSWISRSVTFVLPACDLLSLIMNTLFSLWLSFTLHHFFFICLVPSFVVTFEPNALRAFIPPAASPHWVAHV